MTLKGIIQYAHQLLEASVLPGDTAIDATCGNGNDTLFLSQLTGDTGHVLAFDIQRQAIENTKQLLKKHHCTNTDVIQDSHAHLGKYITAETKGHIGGAIFNLGYLPKSDKKIITHGESTIKALDTILHLLKKDGLAVLVVYHGHEGGKQEKNVLMEHVSCLDQKKYNVLQYGFINQKNNPPFILAVQKK
jgi:16S rRNA C1402 N4-methylase RsmH